MGCDNCKKECSEKIDGKLIGSMTHYYSNLNVGIVKLDGNLKVGDKVKIIGHKTDLEETVESIQIDHKDVSEAKKGDVVGIKVKETVREGDKVYLVE